MTGYLEPTSRLRAATPHYQVAEKALKRQEHLAVSPPMLYPVSREVIIPWLPWDPILSGNMHNFNQEERSCIPSVACLDGTSGGGHAMTWQSWPHQSSSDGPRKGYPVLWETFLEEGLSLGEARDTTFTLTGAGTWVGKSAHLAANPLTIQEGW